MLSVFFVSFLSLLLLCLLSPAVRKSVMEGSDTLDVHEAGLALVASRTSLFLPFDQRHSHFYRKSGQRERTTSMHGKIDYAETQSRFESVHLVSSADFLLDANQCT